MYPLAHTNTRIPPLICHFMRKVEGYFRAEEDPGNLIRIRADT